MLRMLMIGTMQPSAELFQVFDRLLLLRKGGEMVYFGDVGPNATTLIRYFERNGSRVCEPEENPYAVSLQAVQDPADVVPR